MDGCILGCSEEVDVGSCHLQGEELDVVEMPARHWDGVLVFVMFLVEAVKQRMMESPVGEEVVDVFNHHHDG